MVIKDLNQPIADFNVKIIYTENYYQEIANSQDFSLEAFFSGVGGFIGIFLGYSILQIPELLDNFLLFVHGVKHVPLTSKF